MHPDPELNNNMIITVFSFCHAHHALFIYFFFLDLTGEVFIVFHFYCIFFFKVASKHDNHFILRFDLKYMFKSKPIAI